MRRCLGSCKTPRTTNWAHEVLVIDGYGWRFVMHDLAHCPDTNRLQMQRLQRRAAALYREKH